MNIRTAFFAGVMLLYLAVPYYMIARYNNVLKSGAQYRFRAQPVDPYDAFRGRYLNLTVENNPIPLGKSKTEYTSGEEVFITLDKDSLGFAHYSGVSKTRPAGNNYLKSTVSYVNEGSLYINVPENMGRYYLNEKQAPLAEEAYRKLTGQQRDHPDSTLVYLDIRLLNGAPLIEELYFNKLPVDQYLREKAAQ